MKVTRTQLRSQLERQLIEQISVKQINEVAIELYPYLKKVILEELNVIYYLYTEAEHEFKEFSKNILYEHF